MNASALTWTFNEWLLRQTRRRGDDPVKDLAWWVWEDTCWPSRGSLTTYRRHLDEHLARELTPEAIAERLELVAPSPRPDPDEAYTPGFIETATDPYRDLLLWLDIARAEWRKARGVSSR